MPQLSKFTDLRETAMTASTTDSIAIEVDMSGYEGVRFTGVTNTSTGGLATDLTIKHAASTTATFVSVGSSNVISTTGVKGVVVTDVYRPRKRWVSGTLATTSGNAHMALIAELYHPRKGVTTWSTAASNVPTAGALKALVSPTST